MAAAKATSASAASSPASTSPPPEPPLKLYERPPIWQAILGKKFVRPNFGSMERHVAEDDPMTLPASRLPEKPVILSQVEEETIAADPSRREEILQKARRRVNFRIWQQYLRPYPNRENKLLYIAAVLQQQLGPHDHREGPYGDKNAPPQLLDEDIVLTALSLINHEPDRAILAMQIRNFNRCLAPGPLQRVVAKMFTEEDPREEARDALDCNVPFVVDTSSRVVDRIPLSKATRWPARSDEKFQDM